MYTVLCEGGIKLPLGSQHNIKINGRYRAGYYQDELPKVTEITNDTI